MKQTKGWRFALLTTTLAWLLAVCSAANGETIIVNKQPDLGPYWHPLDGTPNGTYVYADSFVYSGPTGMSMTTVGAYMLNQGGGPGTPFQFEVLADSGNSPNPNAVLASTGFAQDGNTSLALFTNTLTSPLSLVTGTEYWIALSTVGQPSQGSYRMGGHTQNSGGYNDNGTFWYSNDPAGQSFDGRALTPEMAIYAEGVMSSVPEPSAFVLASIGGIGMLIAVRRRSRSRPH
jgi:PEP-CTERM motif